MKVIEKVFHIEDKISGYLRTGCEKMSHFGSIRKKLKQGKLYKDVFRSVNGSWLMIEEI